jgi:sterol desaturase/sphingolipid hydroxylase (fatty acid hydroxylase superfamily)
MEVNPVILAIPVFFILIGMEVAYGYFKDRKIYRLNDAVTNISCGVVEQLTGVFAKVFTVAAYAFIYDNFRIFTLEDTWYWIVIAFIGVDFFYYWAHRMSHQVNLFWLGHVVHHQSEDYNLSVALRQSTLQKMFTFYFYFPLAFLGFKTEWFLLMGAFNLLYQFWIHTEIIKRLPRWYEYLFNTPSHHRVHHGRNPKYIDKNHAGTLMIWDRMFGTFQLEEETPTYGITAPMNSWNPVMANVQPFVRLWHELKAIPGFINKVKFTFAPPGWYPKEMGGFKAPEEVDKKTYRKFEIEISPGLNYYLFSQYLIALGFTALFLFNLAAFSILYQLAIAAVIIYSVASLGTLFDDRPHGIKMEAIRFFVTIGVAVFLFFQGLLPLWIPQVLAALSVISAVVVFRLNFHSIERVK